MMSYRISRLKTLLPNANKKQGIISILCTQNQPFTSVGSIFGATKGKATDWNKAVSDAEKIVGYPTSFMSLRCLLSDELSNIALQMRKLVGTRHPLLKTARRLVYDGKHSSQTRGLVVLLVSKAAGPSETKDESDIIEKMVSGIFPRQRSLAEITEMIHTANLIHRGVVDMTHLTSEDSPTDMHLGNKMAVLSGDFLLANASTGLAELQNTYVVELISTAIGDMTRAEFTSLRDEDCNECLPPGGATMQDWEQQTFLTSGSLLSRSCQGALLLANHPEYLQNKAFDVGKYIAFAYQLREDLQPFTKGLEENATSINVTSAPVILHIDQANETENKEILINASKDPTKVLEIMKNSPAIEEAKNKCKYYGQKALEAIDVFQPSEAKIALQKIVKAATTS